MDCTMTIINTRVNYINGVSTFPIFLFWCLSFIFIQLSV